jgi:hypothetical protein
MDGEGFRPEDFVTESPEGFVARAASHFLDGLEGDSVEGWELAAVLFGVLQRNPDGELHIRWRSYPDEDDAPRLALMVAEHAVAKAERERDPESRARSQAREIKDRSRARLLGLRPRIGVPGSVGRSRGA